VNKPNYRPRLLFLAFLVLFSAAIGAAAHPAVSGTLHDFGEMVDYKMTFPVKGSNRFSDTFYAPRPGGYVHHATDIMAAKMVPVVAVRAGTIYSVNWSTNPKDLRPHKCCNLILTHNDGWQSKYYHLNNDTPGTDDGKAWGIAPGILPGTKVKRGQIIGWVGDSTNAESTSPHLHFELVDPEGTIVNPYRSLRNAESGDDGGGTSCSGIDRDDVGKLLDGTRLLKNGVRGTDVRQLQKVLKAVGYDPGGIDGVFGRLTAAAVKAFQNARGLAVDGVVGSRTRGSIAKALDVAQHSQALDPYGPILRPGARGSEVKDIQSVLRAAGFDPGPIDGVYGPMTTAAVSRFQEDQGIGVDGKVGPITRRALSTVLGLAASSC
jgi:peptidoglycan hydrolase-like protein with peptidoglycan-binding domain